MCVKLIERISERFCVIGSLRLQNYCYPESLAPAPELTAHGRHGLLYVLFVLNMLRTYNVYYNLYVW